MRQIVRQYDLVCLGGGPGNYYAARRAAQYGKSVCIIEKERLGGVCLTRGCIPKKLLYCAAQVYKDASMAAEYGVWNTKESKSRNKFVIDWKTLRDSVQSFVSLSSKAAAGACTKEGIEVIVGEGKFVEPNALQIIKDGPELVVKGGQIIVGTGAKAIVPGIKGIERAVSGEYLYEMDSLPQSVLIVGGNYIGIEAAALMNIIGVKTTVCMLETGILRAFDHEVAGVVMDHMKRRGVLFHPGADVVAIEAGSKHAHSVLTRAGDRFEADKVVLAVGRLPNTRGLGLEQVGVRLGKMGEIETNEYDETSCKGVYALGDVTGKPALAPVAKVSGRMLIERLFGPGKDDRAHYKTDYEHIPSAAFSDPPAVRCGMVESEAIERYGETRVKVYRYKGHQLMHALVKDKEPMLTKIVTAERAGKEVVVGIHAAGRNVEEMIVGLALAIRKELTREDLERAIAVHPTGAEEFINMF